MIPVALITALAAGAIAGAGAWTYQANKYDAQIAKIAIAALKLDNKYDAQISKMQREQSIAALKQLEVAHAQTIALQAKADTAASKHATRSAALADAVRRASAERDGLRDELAASAVQLPSASCGSVRDHTATLNELFGQCADQLRAVAGQADGHAADSLMLQEAWPVKSER